MIRALLQESHKQPKHLRNSRFLNLFFSIIPLLSLIIFANCSSSATATTAPVVIFTSERLSNPKKPPIATSFSFISLCKDLESLAVTGFFGYFYLSTFRGFLFCKRQNFIPHKVIYCQKVVILGTSFFELCGNIFCNCTNLSIKYFDTDFKIYLLGRFDFGVWI